MGEGQKALGEKKAAQKDAKVKNNERLCKAAVKAVEKDDSLKRPVSAYWLWLGDNRERIVTMLGSAKGPDVAKKGGEMWKTLSDAARAPYEKKAKEEKEAYDKYIASDEGSAALKAFKDAQQATKDQFKRKAEDVNENEGDVETEAPQPKKARGRAPKVKTAE